MDEILLASGNPHKLEEVRAVLVPLGLRVTGLDDLATVPEEPEEDGVTFEANARIKAIAYARATGRFSLADDSGLEVDALDGAPGVRAPAGRVSKANVRFATRRTTESSWSRFGRFPRRIAPPASSARCVSPRRTGRCSPKPVGPSTAS